jgi:hypothetical protein
MTQPTRRRGTAGPWIGLLLILPFAVYFAVILFLIFALAELS